MAIIKGTNTKKFSKARTDLDVPAIARSAQVAQGLSLTSSADIDINNSENLYFHILGDLPSQILLFIYGEKFNQAFYTEVGIHQHGPGTLATGNVASGSTAHVHSGSVSIGAHDHPMFLTTFAGNHRHALYTGNDDGGYKIDVDGDSANNGYNYNMPVDGGASIMNIVGSHQHQVDVPSYDYGSKGFTTSPNVSVDAHGHLVSSGLSANAGLSPFFGSMHLTGSAKSYFDDMKIAIDGVDKTAQLLTQASLAKFGDGTAGHLIVTTGVQLDLLPFISTPGQHKVTFSLSSGANNGGKIRYNLYTVA